MISTLILIGLDQGAKYLSLHQLFPIQNLLIVHLTLAKNPGVSLGFLSNLPWLWLAALQGILIFWLLTIRLSYPINTLLYAGAISNFIDRVYHGFIIDYLDFHIGSLHWPYVVNLADIYLTLGILLWLYTAEKTS